MTRQACGNSAWEQAARAGDWRRAFAISDAVFAARDPATRDDPRLPYHLRWVWDGADPAGRDVLVRCYHGLGDTLQFARYLAPLAARAASVWVEGQAELLPLLSTVPGVDRWIAFDVAAPAPPRAVDVEIMELSHMLRLGPECVSPPPLPLAGGGRGRVGGDTIFGLSWRSGDWDPARSLLLGDLLAAIPDTTACISLQRGPAAAEARDRFVNPGDVSTDVMRTAGLIGACSHVVTVDSFVAHLAGSLGAPTTLLLRHDADWRWGEGETTPWYPSLRLLRQTREGDWSAPLAALRRAAGG